ncbi:hypothetical protein FN846DRAFT_890459 [Sphaerosporella brunnea]|uniref:F-box domain-containing protein n=1 Tax=Sphaerosporella brunnea TaxID=1250544 RepID=A0A5J5EWT1_9PEZI|nr:hypothetical protein FN846DRAFT_890459 [Sphaerosporella brunnea]
MDRLTPAIILQVLEFLDIPTFLNFRLASRAMKELIAEYETSLTAAIAERILPPYITQLTPPKAPHGGIKRLLALQHRHNVLRETANTILARGIIGDIVFAADDAFADELRTYIQRGLALQWQMADIAETVETAAAAAREAQPPRRVLGIWRPRETTLVRRVEDEILAKRLEHIQQKVSADDVFHYEVMCTTSLATFLNQEVADHSYISNKNWIGRKDAWMNWYLLRHGPPVLLNIWTWPIPCHQTIREINAIFSARKKGIIKTERKAGMDFHKELNDINPTAFKECSNYMQEFVKKDNERRRRSAGAGAVAADG